MKDRNEIKKVDDKNKKKSWIAMATLLIQIGNTLETNSKYLWLLQTHQFTKHLQPLY